MQFADDGDVVAVVVDDGDVVVVVDDVAAAADGNCLN